MKRILLWFILLFSPRTYRTFNGKIQVKERGWDWQDLETHMRNEHHR